MFTNFPHVSFGVAEHWERITSRSITLRPCLKESEGIREMCVYRKIILKIILKKCDSEA
jgi:hypothetical protein